MDVERSLRLWRDGLGFSETWWEARREGTLVGVGVRKDHMTFMLNIRAGTPRQARGLRGRPVLLGARRPAWPARAPDRARLRGSDLQQRDYGQTEFFLTDDDGFEHCFGVPTPQPDGAS
jgi:hypothetical protein